MKRGSHSCGIRTMVSLVALRSMFRFPHQWIYVPWVAMTILHFKLQRLRSCPSVKSPEMVVCSTVKSAMTKPTVRLPKYLLTF